MTAIPPLPVPVIKAVAVYVEEDDHRWGYRPAIQWDGATLWESNFLVPGHHGDYDNDQEAKARGIATRHIVRKLGKAT